MPMDMKQASYVAQEIMEELFHNKEDINGHIDNIGIWGDTFNDHVKSIQE